ncbi:MAG: type II secretion system minor pseudopilin GspI [Gammaproteobacteria bacterium]
MQKIAPSKNIYLQGFTLIEIMVALVILAIALSAISLAISRNAQNATYIDQKMAAHWVAMNIISQQQLKATQPNYIGVSSQEGTSNMLNHTWYWKAETENTTIDQTYHISVDVSTKDNGPSIDHIEEYISHVPSTN